jgi:tRNA nucleotidyltransferase/poly(A) polymerase
MAPDDAPCASRVQYGPEKHDGALPPRQMTEPRILPRAEHTLSRKNIDPDALKVLYRLKHHGALSYLVGGAVRDLLLGRKPKDYDVATSAHPQQVKKLFRNCFIIGRRFRLCHVRFGNKVVEVSTFRRKAEAEDGADLLIRRDNTFGTPEEDAFRRDFTVNALFYDIATFSVIDYVGGLPDLERRVIRTIGEPALRFREDPVRMLRAIALGARLGFSIDSDTLEAIRAHGGEIVKSSPARILEEFYKFLRQGAARETLVHLHETGLLAYLLPVADRALAQGGEALLASLSRLDDYRNSKAAEPELLTNAIVMGTLLVPLGVPLRGEPRRRNRRDRPDETEELDTESPADGLDDEDAEELAALSEGGGPAQTEAIEPLNLPFARRDRDRLRLLLVAQRRLRDAQASLAARRLLASRHYFPEALAWLEIHGGLDGPEVAARWRSLEAEPGPPAVEIMRDTTPAETPAPSRRRRRRRRRRRPPAAQEPTA